MARDRNVSVLRLSQLFNKYPWSWDDAAKTEDSEVVDCLGEYDCVAINCVFEFSPCEGSVVEGNVSVDELKGKKKVYNDGISENTHQYKTK